MPSPLLPATVLPLAIRPMSLPWTVTFEATSVTPALPAFTSASDWRLEPSEPELNRSPFVPWKFTVTTGEPANDGAEAPSMVTVLVIAGSDVPADPDRARHGEVDRVGARMLVGRDDRLAERAGPGTVEVRHRERGQELATFQDLDAAQPPLGATRSGASESRRETRSEAIHASWCHHETSFFLKSA